MNISSYDRDEDMSHIKRSPRIMQLHVYGCSSCPSTPCDGIKSACMCAFAT